MTEKQKFMINEICDWLGIDYDGADDIKSASQFISEHIGEMKKIRFEWRKENGRLSDYNSVWFE